ncbi:hypothetical protein I4U23_012056 [Adineta vaga]|nr:hypothetical protein I4U23_012056 [Adineta vaga]
MDSDEDTNDYDEATGQVTESQSIPIYESVQTYPCSICGRNFKSDSLKKHQIICKKTSQKQPRKVFDTGKQRATDSDIPYQATRETTQFYKDGRQPKIDNTKKKTTNWREGHNELVQTIRQARQITQAIENGAPIPKQLPSQAPSDYVQCEYCHRHFNKYSAERHIPFCETQHKRKQMHSVLTAANNIRTPPRNIDRSDRINYTEHQINSAPSKLGSRKPQKINEDKEYQRSNGNTNGFRRPTYPEPVKNLPNDSATNYNNPRLIKTRITKGNYLRGMQRSDRTNGVERDQSKNETTSYYQQHIAEVKNRSLASNQRLPQQTNGDDYQRHESQKPRIQTIAKHCHECGEAFPVERAKFCCECGQKRFGIE